MYKHKIIYKDLKVRQRLREEKGLQRQFTTYTFAQHSESTQTLLDLDQPSPTSPTCQWCIFQEQNDWEIEEFINGPCYYETDSFEQELTNQAARRNMLEQINTEYMEKIGVFAREEGARDKGVRFDRLLKVISFFQEQQPVQIGSMQERLQAVKFKD